MQPTKIGKYEILDKLGRGTTADVYLAKDTLMGRKVALKVVEPETTDLEPFFKEARLLARLQHPNIVTIHGSDLIDSKVVVDMEYVPGKTLRQLLKDEKQLSLDRAFKIAAQILNALAYAHSRGVIHRDMKPANILIGAEDAVKVVDFGIADVLASQGYLAGAGTFSHMAPECFLDKSDRRSDLYSIGVILYEMLTGELPVQAERNTLTAWKEALDKQSKPRPLTAFLPNAPNGLQGIVSLALSYDKQKRFQTAEAVLDVLKRNDLYLLPNTEAELRQIDRFEAAYNRVDKHLRQELNADRKIGFADVVRQYAQQHPEWQGEKDLLQLGRMRNELRHELMEADQWRPIPEAAEIERLDDIAKNLRAQAKNRPPIVAKKVDALNSSEIAKRHPLPPNQTNA
jgi:serine/threonine protein kinase